ncbi:filamentous hemagglutinin N-terminal domain-containing protein [Nostoc sp.]|uniref:filamentous hemagglutinin N-terminal domain-containing protein n=1 Tax=Nostoc sp. TaxID=1180 RepID=UPI002FFBEB9F
MSNLWVWLKSLGVAIGSVIAFSANSAIAEITPDSTLTENSRVTTQDKLKIIEGGTRVESNLFHSFKEFSVPEGSTAEFKNADGVQNIISRVTGNNVSNIYGTLKTQGTANLFLINPNGIMFGPNASLNIGGSFVASTASSINFADGTRFSATNPQTIPLLTVSVPIGLQFGATAAPIRNQSQASPNGASSRVDLEVQPGKTLALVGGDITLEGGNLTAESGKIELGSVASNSLVSLNSTNQGWVLGYERVKDFQNIQILQRTVDGSNISSVVDTSGEGGGIIQLQGNTVELAGNGVLLLTQTRGDKNGEDLMITSRKLIVRDGAQVLTSIIGHGVGGNLIVNASESIELVGSNTGRTTLATATFGAGKAGDITIKTNRLRIQDGAEASTESSGVFLDQESSSQRLFRPATGVGGNLTVNASESVELIGTSATDPSRLLARTLGSGDAGEVSVTTKQLIVRDGAVINVSSELLKSFYEGNVPNLGKAGNLNLSARFILLDNGGKLTATSEFGRGGNITLQVQDLLLMRRNSQISTDAGLAQTFGDGGNITINIPSGLIVAVNSENSDITANAYKGNGGRVDITTTGIFGIQSRKSNTLQSDITASSQFGLNGTIQINSPDVDPSKGLVELPEKVVDASRKIVASCNGGTKLARSSFTITGRGGVASSPTEPLTADAVLVPWITLEPEGSNPANGFQNRAVIQEPRHIKDNPQKVNSLNQPIQLVEAQGWVVDANGNVVLVAQAPTAIPNSSVLTPGSCAAHS